MQIAIVLTPMGLLLFLFFKAILDRWELDRIEERERRKLMKRWQQEQVAKAREANPIPVVYRDKHPEPPPGEPLIEMDGDDAMTMLYFVALAIGLFLLFWAAMTWL